MRMSGKGRDWNKNSILEKKMGNGKNWNPTLGRQGKMGRCGGGEGVVTTHLFVPHPKFDAVTRPSVLLHLSLTGDDFIVCLREQYTAL